MPAPINLIGHRYGRLVVLHEITRRTATRTRWWRCQCDCGGIYEGNGPNLRSGAVVSCGCRLRENQKRFHEFGFKPTHGLSKLLEYDVYRAMIRRCTNPRDKEWKNYGGRGIAVCNRWLASFEAFLADMGRRPGPDYSIERSNNNRGYHKTNCYWAPPGTQGANRRNNRRISHTGKVLTIQQWARETGLSRTTISGRLRRGWPLDWVFLPNLSRSTARRLAAGRSRPQK